jgi:hypothetical protein
MVGTRFEITDLDLGEAAYFELACKTHMQRSTFGTREALVALIAIAQGKQVSDAVRNDAINAASAVIVQKGCEEMGEGLSYLTDNIDVIIYG